LRVSLVSVSPMRHQQARRIRTGGKPLRRPGHPGTRVGLLCLLLVSLSVLTGRAAPPPTDSTTSVEVQYLGTSPVEAAPDSTVTMAFRVRNRSRATREVKPSVDAPADWTRVKSPPPVTLAPKASTLQLLTLAIPSRAPAQDASVHLKVTTPSKPTLADTAIVDVHVKAVRKLEVSLLRAPDRSTAGTSYSAAFAIRNTGNVPVQAALQAQSGHAFRTQLDTSAVALTPAETKRVKATVWPPRETTASQSRLTVQTSAGPIPSQSNRTDTTSGASASARASVDIIPPSTDNGVSDQQYPTSVRLTTVGTARSQVGQIRVKGEGYLTGDESRYLDIFLRGPGQQQTSSFGRPSVYRATYSTDHWRLRGGDQMYSTTPLAAPRRFGSGAGVRRNMGQWIVGAFAQTARRSLYGSRFASYATFEPDPQTTFTASLVQKTGLFEGTVGAVEGAFTPWQNSSLTTEIGLGSSPDGMGLGARTELSGQHEWGNYRVLNFMTGDDFPSSRNGERLSSGRVRVPVTETSYLFANGRYKRRPSRLRSSPLIYSSARLGAAFNRSGTQNRWSLRLSGATETTPFRDRRFFTIRSRFQRDRMGIGTTVEAGQRSVRTGAFRWFYSSRGQLSLQTAHHQFTGFLKYTTSAARTGGSADSRVGFGLTSRTQLGDHAEVALEATWQNVSSSLLSARRTASVNLRYDLPFGHTIHAQARLNDFHGRHIRTPHQFRVGYDVPMGLPVGSHSETKTLSGRVVNAKNGTGMEDVLIRLGGSKRLTDETGHFSLPLPQEHTAYLQLNPSTTDGDFVPMRDLPVEVTPEDGTSEVIIPLRKTASLTVDVTEYAYPNVLTARRDGTPERVGGREDVVIEATDEKGRQRRVTNDDGTAAFKRLRPGTWTIRFVNPNLSEDRVLKQKTYTVTLSPGENRTVEMKVLPRKPNVQIRGRSTLELDESSN